MVASIKKRYPPRVSVRDEAIALIHERFAAFTNGDLKQDPKTLVVKTKPLYAVAEVPQRALEVGVMVAMYCNPQLAGRITAVNGGMLSVLRGGKVIRIESTRCKALIPVGMEFVIYGEMENE